MSQHVPAWVRDPAATHPAARARPEADAARLVGRRPENHLRQDPLGRPAGDDYHRYPPVRTGQSPGVGPAASAADSSISLEGAHRAAAHHRRHGHQAVRRSPSQRRRSRTGVVVVSKVDAIAADVDRCWQAFLRRFDIEHTFRLFKQTLGWTVPKLRELEAADRWSWLIIIAHTQLRLARPLATDFRRPWEKPAPPEQLTPARTRRGFRNIRTKTPSPAGAPKPSRPGPGRPPGSTNHRTAPRHDVGRILATGERYKRPTHHNKGS